MLWQRRLAERGGVASVRDLHGWSLSDTDIRMFTGYGLLRRVRRGWYCTPDAPAEVVEACRWGGRLACVSALRYRGVRAPDDGRLHIELPANAVVRAGESGRDSVRLHWSRNIRFGDRAAVDTDCAVRQAIACGLWPRL